MARKLERGGSDSPGVLGNPVTFAATWDLPRSKGYLRFKPHEQEDLVGARARRPRRACFP
jgi:hypothetical protein